MRTSTVAAAGFLLLGTGAVGLSAAIDTTGNNIALNGSDTLFEVTSDILAACSGANTQGITYIGGGSGQGEGNMDSNTQEIAPMSRALNASAYCGKSIPLSSGTLPVQTTTQAMVIGLDGIGVFVGTANECSGDLAQAGRVLAVTTNGAGTTPSTACPGCDASSNYTFANSLDVLRVVYGGYDHESPPVAGCASDLRKSLINNWSKLFTTDCATGTCPTGLTHAWRRSDLSGTTDAFISLVGFGSRGIGQLPSVGTSKKVNPFCNSTDANQAVSVACTSNANCTSPQICDTTGFCMTPSAGGASDFADNDPIRPACATNDQVCQANGTLGIVLPIFLPDVKSPAPALSDIYPTSFCSAGRFDLVSSGNVHEVCPGGPNFLGQCFQPYFLNGTAHQFNCIARSNAHAFGSPTPFDGRAFNLPLKTLAGNGVYALDANNREMKASFFRIHTTLAATTGGPTCATATDDTTQIGCLVTSDPCSVGYAGREADLVPNNALLTVNGIAPTNANIIALLGGGGTPYPLARRLYLSSLVGFGHLFAGSGEDALARCFAHNATTATAITNHNFVAMPSGIQCLSYDDAPLPGCGDSPAVTGCSDLPAGYIQP